METTIITGLMRTLIEDSGAYHYMPTAINPTVLSKWSEDVLELMRSAGQQKMTLKLIYDLSNPGVALPFLIFNNYQAHRIAPMPTFHAQIKDVLAQNPDLHVWHALVVTSNLSGKIVSGRRAGEVEGKHVHFEQFFEIEAAQKWLHQVGNAL